ncbi:MAG: glycosyltransferase, partial [Armatimonadetes bacterium]|nr:glycosyltransferase [Armatimonadota bacterium]
PCETIGQWSSSAAVGEYHPYDFDQWAKVRARPAALAIHTIHDGRLPYRPAVAVARSRAIARRVLEADAADRVIVIPLATLRVVEEVKLPARPRTVAWHGIVHRGKGLARLLGAFRQVRRRAPDARLVLIGSRGDTAGTRRDFEELAAVREPGVEVRCQEYWTVEELVRQLERADIYCYPDSDDGEQSGASSDVLGFGRPVVVSESTKHDEVRPWCVTARPEGLAETLMALMTDLRLYAEAAVRAWQGATFRTPERVNRQYRAAIVHAGVIAGPGGWTRATGGGCQRQRA